MKNINIISDYSSVYAGNFISSIYKLYIDLAKKYHVVLSFPEKSQNRNWIKFLKNNGVKIEYFDNSCLISTIRSIKKINKKHKINVVYTHFVSIPYAKLIAPFNKKTKLFIHIHSDFSGGLNKKSIFKIVNDFLFTKLIRKDATYIYVSEALRKSDNLKHSYFIRNALCLDRIHDNIDSSKNINNTDNKTIFLTFGWSPEIKGIDITCRAFLDLPKECADKSILLIVVNENGKDNCINYLKSSINFDITKCDNIRLLLPYENVFSLYNTSNVFISSSRSEGFSYSILEALYFDLEILASDIEGTKWCKEYGALTFSLNNPKELTNLMIQAISKKKNKRLNSKILYAFSIENWVNQIKAIILR